MDTNDQFLVDLLNAAQPPDAPQDWLAGQPTFNNSHFPRLTQLIVQALQSAPEKTPAALHTLGQMLGDPKRPEDFKWSLVTLFGDLRTAGLPGLVDFALDHHDNSAISQSNRAFLLSTASASSEEDGQVGREKIAKRLLPEAVKPSSPWHDYDAFASLLGRAAEVATPTLTELTRSASAPCRRTALRALAAPWRFGRTTTPSPTVQALVVNALKDEDLPVRVAAISLIPALFKDEPETIRLQRLSELSGFLQSWTQDSPDDPLEPVLDAATDAIRDFGARSQSAYPAIIALMKKSSMTNRCLVALASIGPGVPKVRATLEKLARSKRHPSNATAVQQLEVLNRNELELQLQQLLECLSSPQPGPEVVKSKLEGLKALHPEVLSLPIDDLDLYDRNYAIRVIRTLNALESWVGRHWASILALARFWKGEDAELSQLAASALKVTAPQLLKAGTIRQVGPPEKAPKKARQFVERQRISHSGEIDHLLVSTQGQLVGNQGGSLVLLHPPTKTKAKRPTRADLRAAPSMLLALPKNRILAATKPIKTYDLRSFQAEAGTIKVKEAPQALAVSKDSKLVAAGGVSLAPTVARHKDGEVICTWKSIANVTWLGLPQVKDAPWLVAIGNATSGPMGQCALSGGKVDARAKEPSWQLCLETKLDSTIQAACVGPSGLIWVARASGDLGLVDPESGRIEAIYSHDPIDALVPHPDGDWVLVLTEKALQLVDKKGEVVATVPTGLRPGSPRGLAFTESGELVVATEDALVLLELK